MSSKSGNGKYPRLADFPISGDWDKLGISDLAGMSLIKCYWILQNATVTAFTVFKLL